MNESPSSWSSFESRFFFKSPTPEPVTNVEEDEPGLLPVVEDDDDGLRPPPPYFPTVEDDDDGLLPDFADDDDDGLFPDFDPDDEGRPEELDLLNAFRVSFLSSRSSMVESRRLRYGFRLLGSGGGIPGYHSYLLPVLCRAASGSRTTGTVIVKLTGRRGRSTSSISGVWLLSSNELRIRISGSGECAPLRSGTVNEEDAEWEGVIGDGPTAPT